jgi:hypothetical protein
MHEIGITPTFAPRTDLTPEESANVRRALQFLGKRRGTQATLAKVLGMPRLTLRHVRSANGSSA